MTHKLLKLIFSLLAFPSGSSREMATPQKAFAVIRHQLLSLVNLGARFAGHQSYIQQATSLQAKQHNLSVSSAAKGLKDAQHPSSESLCWAKFVFRANGSLLKAVLEQLNSGLRERGGFKPIPIYLAWRDTITDLKAFAEARTCVDLPFQTQLCCLSSLSLRDWRISTQAPEDGICAPPARS